MSQYNATIYNDLARMTGKTFAELERDLAIGNGVIGKAVKGNSTVKPRTLAKIEKLYPHIANQLGIANESKEHEKAPTETAGAEEMSTLKALTIALEAKEQARAAEAEAKTAYKKLAEMAEKTVTNWERTEQQAVHAALTAMTVQRYVLRRDARGSEIEMERLQNEMHSTLLEIAGEQQVGTFSPVGT